MKTYGTAQKQNRGSGCESDGKCTLLVLF